MILDEAKHAVIKVGAGRGFVVESRRGRLVVTAAHCLPGFPRRASVSHSAERTYNALLGPLGKEAAVSTECLFADPIGDIAVLGGPDSQQFPEQAEHYDALVAMVTALPISDTAKRAAGWLLSLDGRWNRCEVRHMVPCGYSTLERGSRAECRALRFCQRTGRRSASYVRVTGLLVKRTPTVAQMRGSFTTCRLGC